MNHLLGRLCKRTICSCFTSNQIGPDQRLWQSLAWEAHPTVDAQQVVCVPDLLWFRPKYAAEVEWRCNQRVEVQSNLSYFHRKPHIHPLCVCVWGYILLLEISQFRMITWLILFILMSCYFRWFRLVVLPASYLTIWMPVCIFVVFQSVFVRDLQRIIHMYKFGCRLSLYLAGKLKLTLALNGCLPLDVIDSPFSLLSFIPSQDHQGVNGLTVCLWWY